MTDVQPEVSGAKHIVSALMAESLMSRDLLRRTDTAGTISLLPQVNVIKIGGQSVLDRGPEALLPLLDELGAACGQHKLLIAAGEGTRARHVYHIAADLGLPTGMLSILGNLVAEQNALIITALMMPWGAVRVPVALIPIFLNGGLPVVLSGMAPFQWYAPPSRGGRIPEHRSDAGAFLTAEGFGCRTMIYAKDVDGLYERDPRAHSDARLIGRISARDLLDRNQGELPVEPVVLEMLVNSRLVEQIQLVNALVPGTVTRALNGEPVGTIITKA